MTSADAQAFKRACACFGLGRYFYEFRGSWVDLDQNQQPKRTPALPAWAIPENWRKGIRPGKNCNGNGVHTNGANGGSKDRKSTRLNSSHQIISYAVFCLKKKKKIKNKIQNIINKNNTDTDTR